MGICERCQCMFVDLQKTYDRIPRDKPWAVLLQYGIDDQLLNAIKSFYMHSEVCVCVNRATTKPFSVALRQGCSLFPVKFLIYMNRIVKKSEYCGGVKIDECTVIYNVCYLRMILCYSTLPKMISSKLLTVFGCMLYIGGKKIRTTKTETMGLSRQPKQCSLQIDGVPSKQLEKFKCLGVSSTSADRQSSELDIGIGKASAVMRQFHRSVLLKRELCAKAKLSIFRSSTFQF